MSLPYAVLLTPDRPWGRLVSRRIASFVGATLRTGLASVARALVWNRVRITSGWTVAVGAFAVVWFGRCPSVCCARSCSAARYYIEVSAKRTASYRISRPSPRARRRMSAKHGEVSDAQLLQPGAQGVLGFRVELDDEPVDAHGDGGLRRPRDEISTARCVARIDDHRQAGELCSSGTASRSSVNRYRGWKVRMPRSQRMTRSLPPRRTYPAALTTSAIVAVRLRFD
jgi:hypothetical protein